MARRRLIVLPERTTQQPIEIPKSLQKKKTIKNIEKNVAHSVLILPKIADKIMVDREQFWAIR